MFEPAVRSAVQQAIQAHQVPGMAVAAVRGGGPAEQLMLGTDAKDVPLARDALLPVASLTKLAAALAVLRLADAGRLSVDDPLIRHASEAAAARTGVTLRRLLSHTSGLPLDLAPGSAPYRPGLDWTRLADACLQTPLERKPGTRVQYSNVGYGLLAVTVERITGLNFPSALQKLVFEPLGIEGYLGVEPARAPALIADVRSEQTGTELEPFNSRFWRSLGFPWAGLVTTLDGALALIGAFRGYPPGFLAASTAAEATRNQAGALAGGMAPPLVWERSPWGLGPELRDAKSPHWAPVGASPDSFGHAGMSGCLGWADPDADVAWAIMGTRTADNGWLVRRGPAIGEVVLSSMRG